jgi:hypothetical protein
MGLVLIALLIFFVAIVATYVQNAREEARLAEAARTPMTAAQLGIYNQSTVTAKVVKTRPLVYLEYYVDATIHVNVLNKSDETRFVEFCGVKIVSRAFGEARTPGVPDEVDETCFTFEVEPHSRYRAAEPAGADI